MTHEIEVVGPFPMGGKSRMYQAVCSEGDYTSPAGAKHVVAAHGQQHADAKNSRPLPPPPSTVDLRDRGEDLRDSYAQGTRLSRIGELMVAAADRIDQLEAEALPKLPPFDPKVLA